MSHLMLNSAIAISQGSLLEKDTNWCGPWMGGGALRVFLCFPASLCLGRYKLISSVACGTQKNLNQTCKKLRVASCVILICVAYEWRPKGTRDRLKVKSVTKEWSESRGVGLGVYFTLRRIRMANCQWVLVYIWCRKMIVRIRATNGQEGQPGALLVCSSCTCTEPEWLLVY